MGKASRVKRRALKSSRRVRRGGGSYGYYGALFAVCVVGITLVVASRASKDDSDVPPIVNQDHWHASLDFNVCGSWVAPAQAIPEFEFRAGQGEVRAGIHSHGDGLMHIHPFSSDESGDNATVGKFMDFGGWDLDLDSFKLADGQEHKDGDECGDAKGELRWSVNGEEQKSNPARYHPSDQDVIAVYFVAGDADLTEFGEPPSAAGLANPVDQTTTSAPGSTAPGETTSTVSGDGSSTTGPAGTTGPSASTTVPGATTTSPPAETTAPPATTTSPATSTSSTAP
jgi:hypothetical protein